MAELVSPVINKDAPLRTTLPAQQSKSDEEWEDVDILSL
jgi:hypothetical protein